MNPDPKDRLDAALAGLPRWEPPPGFAARTARLAAAQGGQAAGPGLWALALRVSAVAVGVSVMCWLVAEVTVAAVTSEAPLVAPWLAVAGSALVAWLLVRRPRWLGA